MTVRYRATRVGGCLSASVEPRSDGTTLLRSTEALRPHPPRLTDRLELWASEAPQRTCAARRDRGGEWIRIGYEQMLDRARCVGQALVERGLSAERPVAILSDNDLEHLTLTLGALWAGVPVAPVSPAYSLLSKDFGKLRHVLATITPGLVFAAGPSYAPAIAAAVAPDVELVFTDGAQSAALPHHRVTPFAELLAAPPGPQGEAAHAAVGPQTIAKFLFTSGSTKVPKAVINTQRMLCANQQMLQQTLAFVADAPPVLVDWLPWNHTFGGNHNVGLALYNGGTLYIDDGKPTPAGIGETLRNLREISPTVYFNVPKGFEEIAAALEGDPLLRERLFARLQAFMYAGAALSQAVWDRLDRLAESTVGERIPMFTGLGMTETSPACLFAVRAGQVRAGHVGLPCPGVEIKLAAEGDASSGKTEIRYRGPNVTPGYWRAVEETARAFDDEGYFRSGDAVQWVDAGDPGAGLRFDGRLAEDFKLSSGTFVHVGALRARVIAEAGPIVQDVVVAGPGRDDIGLLVFPRLDECRRLAGLPAATAATEVLRNDAVRSRFQALIDRLWHSGTGSSNRVERALLMAEPPSIDRGEITDKGSLNQRAVLAGRAALVDALYDVRSADVIVPRRG